jgi:hypothetical protein
MTMTHACRRVAGACVWLAVLASVPASAQAEVGARASVRFPRTAAVGATGLSASLTLQSVNTDLEEVETNSVCNAGDGDPPCWTPELGIVVVPACKQVSLDQCEPAGADPGVFRISATGAGRLGSACGGMTFTTEIVDPQFGTVRFTPPAGARVILPPFSACHIDFTVDVLKFPTGDQDPATPAIDTVQTTAHSQFAGPYGPGAPSGFADATSTGTAVTRARTKIAAASAPASMTLGGQVAATATVSGRVDPQGGATVDFRLYGQDALTCTEVPVFESLGVPVPPGGGPVSSLPFVPTVPGAYRWRATYNGDANNLPVSSPCLQANVFVSLPPPPPAPTPTCAGKAATIVARPGKRFITGTAGADVIVGGLLGERINGGGGDDTICAGMGDDIVRGGGGNDTILGDGDQDRLFGDKGRDLLLGGAGNDDLRGGSGNDRAAGGDGTDRVDGGAGNDTLDDQALGGEGRDQLLGGSGNDRIRTARGGADRVDCGSGRGDSVLVDRLDRQTRCERVRR